MKDDGGLHCGGNNGGGKQSSDSGWMLKVKPQGFAGYWLWDMEKGSQS